MKTFQKINVSVILLLLVGCRNTEIAWKIDTLTFEYGEKVVINPNEIIDTTNTRILDSITIDDSSIQNEEGKEYPAIGEYLVIISGNKIETKTIKVGIQDTKAPTFQAFLDVVEIERTTEEIDITSFFTAEDLSEVSISVTGEEVNTEQVGDYTVMVVATDIHGNKIERPATIRIINSQSEDDEVRNEPYYYHGFLVVNKKHPLPSDYDLGEDAEAADAVRKLIADMQLLDYDVSSSYSGYRSFAYQQQLYQGYVASYGQAEADTFSARAGYSEHQTGLAFDLRHIDGSLVEKQLEAQWVAANAHLYGFIIRYQAGKEAITGYQAEPWHLRYVGEKATEIYESELCLEEYFGVEGGGYNE